MPATIRVIELAGDGAGIAAAHAGWLLAKMGAEVTRVVPARGDAAQPKAGTTSPRSSGRSKC